MKKGDLVYISGPISSIPYSDAERNFDEGSQTMRDKGFVPVNPMRAVPYNKVFNWFDYLSADIKLMDGCSAIYMLKGWENSPGALVEYKVAEVRNLCIILQ